MTDDDHASADQAGDQSALAAKAMATKQAGEEPPHHPPTGDHADEGLKSLPREDQAPSGAFDAEGQRPVLERSRKER